MSKFDSIVPDERLTAIAEMLPECETLADIGCDHGILDAYLLRTERIKRAYLCDISSASLDKARMLFDGTEYEQAVSFHVGDGFHALDCHTDCAVIAGMGASTIAHIISDAPSFIRGTKLFLQANVDVPDIRRHLAGYGYRLTDERIVRAGTRHYVIIAAEEGKAVYSEKELLCGPVLLMRGDPMLLPYSAFRIKVARKALKGAELADGARAQELTREIEIWEDVARCVRH